MTKIERLSKTRRKAAINVPAQEMFDLFEAEFVRLSPSVKIDGFRPGKAPRIMAIEKIGRGKLSSLAIEKAVNKHYIFLLKEHGLVPVSPPSVSVRKYPAFLGSQSDEKDVLEFEVEFDVIDKVKIGDYNKIKTKEIDKSKLEVSKDEIDKIVQYLAKQSAQLKPAPADKVLEMGDWAEIDFEGSVNHVRKDQLSSKNFPIIVGDTKFIPGFEEKILGMKIGEKKTFRMRMPKQIPDKDIAGKDVEFAVVLNQLKVMQLPKINDAFAEKFGHKKVSEMTEAVKKNVMQEKKIREENQIKSEIISQLVKMTKIDLPQKLIEDEAQRLKNSLIQDLATRRLTIELYMKNIGIDEAKLFADLKEQAKKNIIAGIAIGEVAKRENLKGDNLSEAVFAYFTKKP